MKIYVLVSLWLWAGILLSSPLRKACLNMHCRVAKRIYDATIGQIIKAYRKVVDSICGRFRKTKLYVENRTYDLRARVARSLLSEEQLGELTRKNFINAISRERQMDQGDSGVYYEELEKLVRLISGKSADSNTKDIAVKTAFKLSDTVFLQDIITKMPQAQERILLAFEQAEGNAPYDTIKNEEFRKFIRE